MANLLLLIDDYLPSSTRVAAKMFHELAIELKGRGHEVTVITPSHSINSDEYSLFDGIGVLRFKSGDVKIPSKIKRAINESLMPFRAWRGIKAKLQYVRVDGIICYSPSIFWGPLIHKLKKRYSCPTYLVLRDFFPQWAVDAGMIRKNSIIEKYFRFFEKLLYRSVSKIGVMSEANLALFRSIQNTELNVEVLRNWANTEPNTAKNSVDYRQALGLENKVIFFYGGNIGHAQDMPTLVRLARSMLEYDNAHFLFVGQGDQVELICELAEKWKLSNFTYLPSVSQTEFKVLVSQIDVGLFSLSSKHTTHNFPGKLLGYMVNSIPILGCVNNGNDLKAIVCNNNAGFIHDNGEDEELYQSARLLLEDNETRRKMGIAAHNLLIREFSVESAAEKIVNSLLVS